MMKQILHAVAYLHSRDIVHRDLKPVRPSVTNNRRG